MARPLMKITRTSLWDQSVNTMDMKINPKDMMKYRTGKHLIQDCFPYLSKEEREFIKTGYTLEQQKLLFARPMDEEE